MRVLRRYLILLVAILIVGLGIATPRVLQHIRRRRALVEWKKLPPYSDGPRAGSHGPGWHSRQFWEVLEAFDLDGRPAEDPIAVLGKPDRARSVDWYSVPVRDEVQGIDFTWPLPWPKGRDAPEGWKKILEGKV
ncbi:MAG: hypothetical protein ACYTKD_27410, partial [Planctomycetota bacterium]